MAVTADEMKKQTGNVDQFKAAYDQRQKAAQSNIDTTVGNTLNEQKTALQTAYDTNTAAQTEATQAGQNAYNAASQDLGVQSARQQRNMDQFADVRGLNRQPGSQQALSLGRASSTAQGRLASAQQRAAEESARQQELLKTNYQNQVKQAVADHDYKRAAALMDDYNNQNNWLDKNASILASYGNFSGYEQLYGTDQANAMRNYWIASNPDLAYNTGAIDAAKYKEITGRNAPDYVAPNNGSGQRGGPDIWWYLPEAHNAAYNNYINGGSSGGNDTAANAEEKTFYKT